MANRKTGRAKFYAEWCKPNYQYELITHYLSRSLAPHERPRGYTQHLVSVNQHALILNKANHESQYKQHKRQKKIIIPLYPWNSKAMPGILCPFRGPSVHKKCLETGEDPAKGTKMVKGQEYNLQQEV